LRIELLDESSIRDTGGSLVRPRGYQVFFLNVQTDYMLGAVPGHFERLTPVAEIENRCVSNLIPDARTKQRFDLAAASANPPGLRRTPIPLA
jgi:hypothetical protein